MGQREGTREGAEPQVCFRSEERGCSAFLTCGLPSKPSLLRLSVLFSFTLQTNCKISIIKAVENQAEFQNT